MTCNVNIKPQELTLSTGQLNPTVLCDIMFPN